MHRLNESKDQSAGRKARSSQPPAVLYGVPSPIEMESPASWLTRAALSQGVSPREFCKFLGFKVGKDIDLCITREAIRNISLKCGIDPRAFSFSRHMFSGLMSFDRQGTRFLLFGKGGARYRYCPVCLKEQTAKHFPVHWRFNAWRYCPLHECLMEDRCRACGLFVELPGHLMEAGPEKEGIAYLNQCLGCGVLLNKHWAKVSGVLTQDLLISEEQIALKQGRAVLAAIYQRKLYYGNIERPYRLKVLIGLARSSAIPHEHFLLDVGELERRQAQFDFVHRP